MPHAPNAWACSRCQAKFRRNSKWWDSIREKEGKRALASVYVCILFLSRARDGITHSRRQCQESGVDNDAEAERPEHVGRVYVSQTSVVSSILLYEASVPRCTKNMSTFKNTDFFLFQRSEKPLLERQFFENQITLKKFGDIRYVSFERKNF